MDCPFIPSEIPAVLGVYEEMAILSKDDVPGSFASDVDEPRVCHIEWSQKETNNVY